MAFHRMNLNQNKCLNSSTASNMAAKVAKPIKNGRKQGRLLNDRISFFWNANKNFGVAGKYYGRSGNRKHTYIFLALRWRYK